MKEYEIRPKSVFDEFLDISIREAAHFFSDKDTFVKIFCPACASSNSKHSFKKNNFDYEVCENCGSLYLNPRPTPSDLSAYYQDSKAVEHWAKVFYKDTENARRAQIVKPRAELVGEWARKLSIDGTYCDVGSGFGVLLEEVIALEIFENIVGIEPAEKLAQKCRNRGFGIIEKNVEDLEDGEIKADFATCFEVIEHVFEPSAFLHAISEFLSPGGVFVFTTLTISGFDLAELWSNSKSVCPPNHLNLMSVSGLEILVKRCDMEILEISTPGKLDVDILRNMLLENPKIQVSHFARQISEASEFVRENFQEFLRNNQLSSHVRVIARKP